MVMEESFTLQVMIRNIRLKIVLYSKYRRGSSEKAYPMDSAGSSMLQPKEVLNWVNSIKTKHRTNTLK